MDAPYLFLLFLISLIGVAISENEVENIEDSETGRRELRAWPWGNKQRKFVCPSLFGAFADITDCSSFYICVGGIANRKTCNRRMQFDKHKKVCLPFIIAVCDKGEDDGKTTARPATTNDGEGTTKDTFTCPSIVGKFQHPDDCSKYYSCTFYISSLKSCPDSELFDNDKKECRKAKNVHCGSRKRPNGDDNPTTEIPTTKKDVEVGTTTNKGLFICPSLIGFGKYEYPEDCSKYYSCAAYIASVKSCPKSELFDGIKKQCRPAKEVNCGTRQNPNEATTEKITPITTETPIPTEPEAISTTTTAEPETTTTSTAEPETTTTTTAEPETTTTTTAEPETTTTTTAEPETTTTTTAEPETTTTPTEPETTTTTTTEEPTTTKRPKVTAPDTDCDEDDVDCIIDDLGETPDWFVCEEDIGSYPHPSSKKLFIFCLNWKPSVKKCGQDLVFSEDLMTCVHPF